MDRATTRIIFMGTPEFALPGLRILHEQGAQHNWQIVAVATQPDRPAGRGKKLVASPVKSYAQAQGLPILQPDRLRKRPQALADLAALAADLFVVAAYGIILPSDVLRLARFGSLNIHASLLPAYRGASPIAAALLDGCSETGVSIMLMDEGMDTGPVLAQARQAIEPTDTTATLSDRLANQGAQLLLETLPGWLAGTVAAQAQVDLPGEPSLCRLIKKDAGRIDWTRSAQYIERMTRAYTPWPSAFTMWNGRQIKIWEAEAVSGLAEPGRIVETADGPAVGTGDGLLVLRRLQPAGKRTMDIRSFLNGAAGFVGGRLED